MPPSAARSAGFPVLCQAGFFFFRPGQVVESACVQSRGVLFCENGYGEVEVNNEVFSIGPGSVLLLPWGRRVRHRADRKAPMSIVMNHVVPWHAAGVEVEFVIAHETEHALFDNRARRDAEWAGQRAGAARAFHVERHAPLALMATFCARWYLRRSWQVDEARWLAEFLGREVRHVSEKTAAHYPDAPPELRRIVNFLEQNFQKPLRIPEVAAFAGRSESHVVKLFQRYVGISPKRYLQQRRLARARELLHVSDLSVAEVGRAVGFATPYHFTRAFHRAVGEPPLAYRRKDLSL